MAQLVGWGRWIICCTTTPSICSVQPSTSSSWSTQPVGAFHLRLDLRTGRFGCDRNSSASSMLARRSNGSAGISCSSRVGLSGVYLMQSIGFIVTGQLPAIVRSPVTPPMWFSPWIYPVDPVAGSWSRLVDEKRQPWGYVVAGILSVKGPLYTLVLAVNSLLVVRAGISQTSELPLWGTLTVLGLIAGALLFGNMKSSMKESSEKERTWQTAIIHPIHRRKVRGCRVGFYSSTCTGGHHAGHLRLCDHRRPRFRRELPGRLLRLSLPGYAFPIPQRLPLDDPGDPADVGLSCLRW